MNAEIKAIRITHKPTEKVYELDFSRESVVFAMDQHFNVDDIKEYPTVAIPNLFYFSLRKNHSGISKNKAEKLFAELFPKGMPPMVVGRLYDLYITAAMTDVIADSDEEAKNADVLIEL